MLRLVLGTDWPENRREILRYIAADVAGEKPGRILMVPELISHDTERRLCAAAGDSASRFAQVLTFSRLAQRVCEFSGRSLEPAMDAGGRVVAMASAARQLSGQLKSYASLETKPEFLTQLVDAMDEFKRCCITPADLADASRRSQGLLAQKLEELALLLETYDALCTQGQRDPRDQMTLLLAQLQENNFAQEHVFYIDGFPDFTRQHMLILEHMIRFSDSVTVSLCADTPGSSQLSFEKPGETARELLQIARRYGIPVEIVIVESKAAEPLRKLRENLFSGKLPDLTAAQGSVHVLRFQTPMDECIAAARKIQELVRSGCRYRDIAVVCPSLDSYRSLIRLAFHRCGIPLYLSGTEDILNKSVVHTVLCALDAAVDGLERDSVLRYIKSVLSPLSASESDEIENYARTWNIQGRLWEQNWSAHPDGLNQEWTDTASARLEALNVCREAALSPLCRLRRGMQNARSLGDHVKALYAFLEDIQLSQRLDTMARELDAAGDNRSAQELDQLWEILISALEQLYDVLGETHWDTDAFSRLLRLLLGNYDVGTIPPVLDAVTVGAVSAMRCQECRHLLILGALEGTIPSYAGSDGVLSDQERNELRKLGVPLTGGGLDGLKTEYSEIYGCFCGASESVTVSAPSGQEAYIYRRICSMLRAEPEAADVSAPMLQDAWDVGAYLARTGNRDAAILLQAQEGYDDTVTKTEYSLGRMRRDTVEALYGRKLRLSASQIDRQAECRLSYFLQYGLRAKERKEAAVDPAEFGTFVHAVLEKTARQIRDMGGFRQVSLEQTLEISQQHAREYADIHFSQLDSQRMSYLLQRNGQELKQIVEDLWEELQKSEFQPVDFEVRFGSGGKMDAIPVPGGAMAAEVRGFVDRVDLWESDRKHYFRVVDYKTGRKDFDYCDVFNGVGLQMLLYMFALEQGGQEVIGNASGAGVQYFPARSPVISADGKLTDEDAAKQRQKLRRRKGLILNSDDVLEAMEPGEEFNLLPCSRRKDGTITGDLASGHQFRQLKSYLSQLLRQMVDEIASGQVDPNPYCRGTSHDACTFCPYSPICRETSEESRRNYKTMTPQRFWEEIEKEE